MSRVIFVKDEDGLFRADPKKDRSAEFVPEISVRRPRAYVVPASRMDVVDHLRAQPEVRFAGPAEVLEVTLAIADPLSAERVSKVLPRYLAAVPLDDQPDDADEPRAQRPRQDLGGDARLLPAAPAAVTAEREQGWVRALPRPRLLAECVGGTFWQHHCVLGNGYTGRHCALDSNGSFETDVWERRRFKAGFCIDGGGWVFDDLAWVDTLGRGNKGVPMDWKTN